MLDFSFAADWPMWVPTILTIVGYSMILAIVWVLPASVTSGAGPAERKLFDLRLAVTALVLIQIGVYWMF